MAFNPQEDERDKDENEEMLGMLDVFNEND